MLIIWLSPPLPALVLRQIFPTSHVLIDTLLPQLVWFWFCYRSCHPGLVSAATNAYHEQLHLPWPRLLRLPLGPVVLLLKQIFLVFELRLPVGHMSNSSRLQATLTLLPKPFPFSVP